MNFLSYSVETGVKARSFPLVQEAELRSLIAGGAEIEIVCLEEADKDARNRGEWIILVHRAQGERLVLVSSRSKHRIFLRFEGLCAYAAHTLELGEICIPMREGQSCRGMYHRGRQPVRG